MSSPMQPLSHEAAFTVLETSDVGGTNAATPWLSMVGLRR